MCKHNLLWNLMTVKAILLCITILSQGPYLIEVVGTFQVYWNLFFWYLCSNILMSHYLWTIEKEHFVTLLGNDYWVLNLNMSLLQGFEGPSPSPSRARCSHHEAVESGDNPGCSVAVGSPICHPLHAQLLWICCCFKNRAEPTEGIGWFGKVEGSEPRNASSNRTFEVSMRELLGGLGTWNIIDFALLIRNNVALFGYLDVTFYWLFILHYGRYYWSLLWDFFR